MNEGINDHFPRSLANEPGIEKGRKWEAMFCGDAKRITDVVSWSTGLLPSQTILPETTTIKNKINKQKGARMSLKRKTGYLYTFI